jgi:hypothetical protein
MRWPTWLRRTGRHCAAVAAAAEAAERDRDADEPRALATRMIAVGRRPPRGWTLNTADGSHIEALTFESVTDAVTAVTGVHHLLISGPDGTRDEPVSWAHVGHMPPGKAKR